jgi:predicted MPP superfamily phosphohydrolase
MQDHIISIIVIVAVLLSLDFYIINGLSGSLNKWRPHYKRLFIKTYWIASVLLLCALCAVITIKFGLDIRAAVMMGFFLLMLAKICVLPFILIDDARRLLKRYKRKHQLKQNPDAAAKGGAIPRSEFLLKAGLLAATVPMATLTYGITEAVYDYHIKRHVLYLPNLPKAFDGLKLGQISDIHSGSFYNKKAVTGGVDMLMREKPDLIFFTGDLVNDYATEMRGYQDIFSKVKAPLGVFSSLGNHDYGDYTDWPSDAAKWQNRRDIRTIHKNMGWQLLANENRRLKVSGEEIGILGCENWGALGTFQHYGKMKFTAKNTDDLPVKLLMSHDPTHWRAQILPEYPQIDVMFAGHTHGRQFGIETKSFQWSPVEYIYREWDGLYREGKQQLYVNVGYGFLGYTGRVGILPEITIFELKAANNPELNNA